MCIRFIAVLIVASIALIGCKSINVSAIPNSTINKNQNYYVVQRENGGVHQVISDELNLMGYRASTGPEQSMPVSTNVMVTFNPKWQWDITMYLLELKVEFRNPRDKSVWVSGRTYRPSLQRKDSSVMAREVLESMFAEASSLTDTNNTTRDQTNP
jgi:hypothetical protein